MFKSKTSLAAALVALTAVIANAETLVATFAFAEGDFTFSEAVWNATYGIP